MCHEPNEASRGSIWLGGSTLFATATLFLCLFEAWIWNKNLKTKTLPAWKIHFHPMDMNHRDSPSHDRKICVNGRSNPTQTRILDLAFTNLCIYHGYMWICPFWNRCWNLFTSNFGSVSTKICPSSTPIFSTNYINQSYPVWTASKHLLLGPQASSEMKNINHL